MIEIKQSEREYMLRVERNKELKDELLNWARENSVESGHFNAIGACKYAKVGRFNTETKEYEWWEYDKQLELVSLTGNLTQVEGGLNLHIHVVLSDETGKAMGGHLKEFTVRPTCEIYFNEFENPVKRKYDEESTLDLISE